MANAASVANEIFNLIHGQETNFAFPVNQRTVTVGTFDAAKGTFSYSVPTYTEEVPNDTQGKQPQTVRGGKIHELTTKSNKECYYVTYHSKSEHDFPLVSFHISVSWMRTKQWPKQRYK